MGWWRSKTSGEKRTDQHGDDSGRRADVGTGEAAIVKAIAEGVAKGVTDALLDRVKPGVVERVKGMFR